MRKHFNPRLSALFTATFLFSCKDGKQDKPAEETTKQPQPARPLTPTEIMKRYEQLVIDMKADSISQLFAMNAEVSSDGKVMAKGRDSIYSFLKSFTNVQVLSNLDSVISLSQYRDTTTLKGVYKQTVVMSGKDTITVQGEFTSIMLQEPNQNWLIYRMSTKGKK